MDERGDQNDLLSKDEGVSSLNSLRVGGMFETVVPTRRPLKGLAVVEKDMRFFGLFVMCPVELRLMGVEPFHGNRFKLREQMFFHAPKKMN